MPGAGHTALSAVRGTDTCHKHSFEKMVLDLPLEYTLWKKKKKNIKDKCTIEGLTAAINLVLNDLKNIFLMVTWKKYSSHSF